MYRKGAARASKIFCSSTRSRTKEQTPTWIEEDVAEPYAPQMCRKGVYPPPAQKGAGWRSSFSHICTEGSGHAQREQCCTSQTTPRLIKPCWKRRDKTEGENNLMCFNFLLFSLFARSWISVIASFAFLFLEQNTGCQNMGVYSLFMKLLSCIL